MNDRGPVIAVLGASGLIGHAVASFLIAGGFDVVAVARRFTPAQAAKFSNNALETPIVDLSEQSLTTLTVERDVRIVVNCLGVLQDGARGTTYDVHVGFLSRLLSSLAAQPHSVLLIHLSIPGLAHEDETPFSRSKRDAEQMIASGTIPFVILRPGFVVARAAYGGSALVRALAVLPFKLPAGEGGQVFAAADVDDIARTISFVVGRWRDGAREWAAIWDVMELHPKTVDAVVAAFRERLAGSKAWAHLPTWMLDTGAKVGDAVAYLGWSPAVRSTALRELRRGVRGCPSDWIAATGIQPRSFEEAIRKVEPTIQEKWFARLYLAKPLVIASLVVFWLASGLIALTISYDEAVAILTSHGFGSWLARATTITSSSIDIAVGVAIAFKRTSRAGLIAGLCVSALYMIGAAFLAPDLWVEPLGALVKTVPAMVLMLVALAIFDDR